MSKDNSIGLKNDTMLPSLPTDEEMENFVVELLAFLQQWGVIVCSITALICIVIYQLFKVRKNPQLVRLWRFLAYGFIFIAIVFAVSPYLLLPFIE
ncbi:hypothetical protein GLW08_21400 [Pontibacillus yanchengensis]|uniref:Uncharacterized protein n=2 Tax=Pontibacillus yanchengensis TaxID=462910 RepID=A0ACC7VM62_9BACI|nr:hypothetical protein [Pontibacillus yanchengensis]MYL35441.1 hypothetical protein [Pontibacillus yanchengensis]MYL55860.1 hypothetical protein [Pontibacillus yanchengensis]